MPEELILYSTEHCTLCDEALEMLFSMPELAGHSVRVVDIALDDALLARFAEKLPVLEIPDGTGAGELLEWPFDSAAVAGAIRQIG